MSRLTTVLISAMFPTPSNQSGGVFVYEQAQALHRQGTNVSVMAPVPLAPRILWFKEKWRAYGKLPQRAIVQGLNVWRPRYFRPPGARWAIFEAQAMALGLQGCILNIMGAAERIDILHAHRLIPEGWAAVKLGRKVGLPVVITAHGGDVYETPFRSRSLLHQAQEAIEGCQILITVSSKNADILTRLGADPGKVRVIPNGYRPLSPAYKPVNRARDELRFCYLGRIAREKGVLDLLEAFKKVVEMTESKGLKLTYIGDGPVLKELRQRISDYRLENVSCLGNVDHSLVQRELAQHDVFVLPSYKEGLPTALVEAMAAGLAAIGTDVGGIPELIVDHVTGLLVKPKDIDGLVVAMRKLIEYPRLRGELSRNSRSLVESYSWDRIAERIIEVYHNAIKTA